MGQFSIFSLFVYFFVQNTSVHSKLVLLQSVFRHGDRAPTHLYTNDPNPPYVWPEGLGKLTQLGRKQHYMLGKQLRSLYTDFITSNPNEVLVNSTGIDRCVRSAESHLAGLYAPAAQWQFTPDLKWQPIPVHYTDKDRDKYLSPDAICPRAAEESKRILNSMAFKSYQEEYEPMLKNLSSCAGETLTVEYAVGLANTLQIEMKYNLKIPACMLPYYNELQDFGEEGHNVIYGSPLIQRLRAGPLLGLIVDNMNSKIAGEIPERKVQVYSSRDRTLVAVLNALDLFNDITPPYCSTLLFELHDSDDIFTVRLLFLNSTRPEDGNQVPYVLQMPGCTEYCPLEYFAEYTRPFVPLDWTKECELRD